MFEVEILFPAVAIATVSVVAIFASSFLVAYMVAYYNLKKRFELLLKVHVDHYGDRARERRKEPFIKFESMYLDDVLERNQKLDPERLEELYKSIS